jgi:DNA replication initiation complex subunit (GINS family)
MKDFSVEKLYSILKEEKMTGELLPLPENFYSKADSEMPRQTNNEEEEKAKINYERLLGQIKRKRTEKVLLYLAYNKGLPHPVPDEEKELYAKVTQMITDAGATTKVRILNDTPELTTPTGRKIGPYRKDQITEATKEEYEFILKNKLGETELVKT